MFFLYMHITYVTLINNNNIVLSECVFALQIKSSHTLWSALTKQTTTSHLSIKCVACVTVDTNFCRAFIRNSVFQHLNRMYSCGDVHTDK